MKFQIGRAESHHEIYIQFQNKLRKNFKYKDLAMLAFHSLKKGTSAEYLVRL